MMYTVDHTKWLLTVSHTTYTFAHTIYHNQYTWTHPYKPYALLHAIFVSNFQDNQNDNNHWSDEATHGWYHITLIQTWTFPPQFYYFRLNLMHFEDNPGGFWILLSRPLFHLKFRVHQKTERHSERLKLCSSSEETLIIIIIIQISMTKSVTSLGTAWVLWF